MGPFARGLWRCTGPWPRTPWTSRSWSPCAPAWCSPEAGQLQGVRKVGFGRGQDESLVPSTFFIIPTASSASPSLGTRLLRPDLGPHQGGFLPKQVEPYTRVHSSVSARLSLLLSWVAYSSLNFFLNLSFVNSGPKPVEMMISNSYFNQKWCYLIGQKI